MGHLTLTEEETKRRDAVMAPLLQDLKDAKDHIEVLREQAYNITLKELPALEALQVMVNFTSSDAKALCMQVSSLGGLASCCGTDGEQAHAVVSRYRLPWLQVLGACRAMTNMYVEAVLKEVLPLVSEAAGKIDAAREAKENYYEVRALAF